MAKHRLLDDLKVTETFVLSPDEFVKVEASINAPPKPNAALKRLMRLKPYWVKRKKLS